MVLREICYAVILTIRLYCILSRYFLLSYITGCNHPDMGEKKVFSTRIDDEILKKLKHLAVDEDASLGDLLEESINDLLGKYEKKRKESKKK